jgi:hypothetical protein
MMRKKKGKSIHKTKKKVARPAKRTRGKASSRKKKTAKSQSQTARVLAVEVTEVEVTGDIEQDSVDETEATVIDPLDEHFPPDYGGSE